MLKSYALMGPVIKNIISTPKSISSSLVRRLCSEIKNEQNVQSQTDKEKNTENFSEDIVNVDNVDDDKVKLSGFAKAFEKFNEPEPQIVAEKEQTFAALLRHSSLIDLGDPNGKKVMGIIFHVVEDDLYIDFGWKFHCVCPRPFKNGQDYTRGSKVTIRIKELELSTKFLGSSKDLTILEADCALVGLTYTHMKNVNVKKL